MKNRSKFKEALRPIVKEALSDYLKDTEEETRALQAAHPQLDIKQDLPSETPNGDNVTKGVRTEDIEGDVKWIDKSGARVKKVNGKTVIFPANPKNTQKIADALNDSGEYEVEVLKGGGILVKYQSPLTKMESMNEAVKERETPEAKRLKDDLTRELKVNRDRIKLGAGFAPKTTPKGNLIVVGSVGESSVESDIRADYYAKVWTPEYYFIVLLQKNGSLIKVLSKSKTRPAALPKKVDEASTTAGNPDMGYQTPYAFSDVGLDKDVKKRKIAQQLGYKIVKKNSVKEEVNVNIVKAVPINEGFRPQLSSPEAKALFDKIDYYMMVASDPQYSRIHQFRTAISKLKNPHDQKQMVQYFNDEFKITWGSASQSAWDYYKSPS